MSVSVLILTLNEEANLPRCLESVGWSDDVVVLDDGSTDRTVEIAEAWGARVIRHSAGGERAQRSYSLSEIDFKYPWVYNPDADEVTPNDLRDEIIDVVSDRSRKETAYRLRFKTMFMGRWVKHSSLYPTWVVRLFRPECLRLTREINLTYEVEGTFGYLDSHFKHYSFNNGMGQWFDKHNRYSSREAEQALLERNEPISFRNLLSRAPENRRRALKLLAWRFPCRALVIFFYLYFVRFGFLDGRAGLDYCLLRSSYEYMIDIKVKELHRRSKGLPI